MIDIFGPEKRRQALLNKSSFAEFKDQITHFPAKAHWAKQSDSENPY